MGSQRGGAFGGFSAAPGHGSTVKETGSSGICVGYGTAAGPGKAGRDPGRKSGGDTGDTSGTVCGAFRGLRVSNVPTASTAEALPTFDVTEASNVGQVVERVPAIRRWMSQEHRTSCRHRKPPRFRRWRRRGRPCKRPTSDDRPAGEFHPFGNAEAPAYQARRVPNPRAPGDRPALWSRPTPNREEPFTEETRTR
jgi:hypothetical protein